MAIICNRASVTFDYEGAENPGRATSNTACATVVDRFSLNVNKSSMESSFELGENITYTIQITNTGLSAINNFTITDNLGEISGSEERPLVYLTGSSRLFINGALTTIAPTDTLPLSYFIEETLEPGQSLVVSYVATVNDNLSEEVDSITNSVTVSSINGDEERQEETISDTDSHTIHRQACPRLCITKTVSQPTIVDDEEFYYTLTVTNYGNMVATNAVITDTLPQGFTVSRITMLVYGETTTVDPSDYTIDPITNTLTLPNSIGGTIYPGAENRFVITIYGVYNSQN